MYYGVFDVWWNSEEKYQQGKYNSASRRISSGKDIGPSAIPSNKLDLIDDEEDGHVDVSTRNMFNPIRQIRVESDLPPLRRASWKLRPIQRDITRVRKDEKEYESNEIVLGNEIISYAFWFVRVLYVLPTRRLGCKRLGEGDLIGHPPLDID